MVCRVITDLPYPPPLGCGGISRRWEGITLRSALIHLSNMAFDGGRLNFRLLWNWVLNIWKERLIVILRYKINSLKWKKVDEWVSQVQFTVHGFNIPGVKIIQDTKDIFKSHATAKSGFFVFWGEGVRPKKSWMSHGTRLFQHLARITLSSRGKQYICNYCSVIVRK